MISKQISRRFSKDEGVWVFAYDLGEPAYLGSRFVAVASLDIGAMRRDDAVKALHSHSGMIYKCKTAKEAIRITEEWNSSY